MLQFNLATVVLLAQCIIPWLAIPICLASAAADARTDARLNNRRR